MNPFNPAFFILLVEKSPEIFPKHKRYFFSSESLAFKRFIYVA